MKYFLYTSVLFGGGAERVLCELANNLSKKNDVTLIASYQSETEYYICDQVKKIYIDDRIENKSSIKQIIRLRSIIQETKPDAVISFLPFPNFKMLIATIGLKTKKIISVRNDPNREYPTSIMRHLAFLLYKLADGVVFQTKDAQDFFPEKIRNKSKVIMNQVDNEFFKTSQISEDYYVATGRLNKQKNYEMMISAFAKFVQRFPDEKLYIYGEGDERKSLEKLITQLNVEKNIFLKGTTSNIPDVLSHAKAFILTSDFEGMPNGLLEAMAVGLPCISTDCPAGGPKEIIETGINGLLIPIGNEKILYEKLVYMQSNDMDRKNYGYNAKIAANKFAPEKIFKLWEKYINEIICNE